jgi:subtilisin family serine protease
LAGKLLPGYDFVDGDSDPSEVGTPCPSGVTTGCNQGFGHGTHVAGLIALSAPNAKIVPYRVLDPDGVGNVWVLAEAMQKAIDPDGNPATDDGAHVINLSLGTPLRMKVLTSIAKLFTCEPPDDTDPLLNFSNPGYDNDKTRCANGIAPVIVAAAGNLGPGDPPAKEYPAAESVYGLIAVGASDASKHLASFSNSGSWVSVAAPGDAITSAMPTSASATGYATWSGTSMAAPLVAGTAALLRAAQPELAPRDVVRKIERTATPLTGTNIPQIDAAAVVETCSMDIDGDGQALPTTDGLIIMRAMMGMTGTAVSNAATATAARNTWDSIRSYLKNVCLMNLP